MMEENKNVELEQNQNSDETTVTENLQNIEEVSELQKTEFNEDDIDEEFLDIDKEEMKKNYIIISILYVIVIILSVLLILGLKNQKDIVKNNINLEANKGDSK